MLLDLLILVFYIDFGLNEFTQISEKSTSFNKKKKKKKMKPSLISCMLLHGPWGQVEYRQLACSGGAIFLMGGWA